MSRGKALLGAFLVALLFWLYARLGQLYVTSVLVPLRIQLPPGVALAVTPPSEIMVQLQGTGWRLLSLAVWGGTSEAAITVPPVGVPSTVGVGRQQLLHALSLPSGVVPLHVVPDTLTLSLEVVRQRRLPVRSQLRFAVPEGFVLTRLQLEPESVTVYGAERILGELVAAITPETTLAPRRQEFTFMQPLRVEAAGPVELRPQWVRLWGQLQPEAEVVLEDVPVEVVPGFFPAGHELLPRVVRVWVRGPLERLLRLSVRDVRVHVPRSLLLQDTLGVLRPQVEAPADLEVFRLEPPVLFHWQQR